MILILRTALRTATFSKGNVAQELRRDSSCATLPFAVLVLRYLLYMQQHQQLQQQLQEQQDLCLNEKFLTLNEKIFKR